MKLKIILEPSEEGGFTVFVPALPGCISEGDTKKGALKKIQGHCYVKMSEYKTKKEKQWIKEDTKRNRFSYRNKKYRLIKIALRSR